MTWLTPLAGAILAAAVVPPLVLLYFLRLRRSSSPIASTLLWQRSVEDLTANAPFQRLRFGILLLLQLLALAMLAIAIMQPRLEAQKRDGGRTVFLIDNSASMTATDNKDDATRLTVAKNRARSLVEEMYAGGFMADAVGETMIIAFSDRAEVVSRFTDSKTSLLNAIDRIQPTHGESRLAEALQLARAYTTNVNPDQQDRPMDDPATIELFTDGRIQDLKDQVLRGETLNYHAIGNPEADNVAIAAVSVDRPYDRPTAVEVFISLINYNPVEITGCEVQLSIDGTGVGVREIDLRPAETTEDGALKPARHNLVFLPFEQPRGAVIEVAIVRNDDLAADNIANVVLPPARKLKVALVEPKSRVLSFALEGLSLSELNLSMTAGELEALIAADNIDAYDVYFLDNCVPMEMTAGRFVTFGVTPPLEGLNPYGEGTAQVVLSTDSDHPTMRYVNFDNIFVGTSTLLEPTRDVRKIIEGTEGPLMVEVIRGPLAVIHVAFDPLESNMPLLRSFPTWVYNVVDYLGHLGEGVATQGGKPGEALTARVPANAQNVRIELPNGTNEILTPSETSEVSWGPARLAGVYQVSWDQPEAEDRIRRDFAVNLLSDREGDIVPRETLVIGSTVTKGDLGTRAAYTPLWPWAVGVCLMLMMTEWWIFHRRARI